MIGRINQTETVQTSELGDVAKDDHITPGDVKKTLPTMLVKAPSRVAETTSPGMPRVSRGMRVAALVVICCTGAFAIARSEMDVYVMLLFGAIAYVMQKMDFPPVPIVLGMVLAWPNLSPGLAHRLASL